MSKEGSQVAFIPDNISNISSSRQPNNEDTSQKVQESYISKLTKLQNNNIDTLTGLQSAQLKTPAQVQIGQKIKNIVSQIQKKINGKQIIVNEKAEFSEQPIHNYPKTTTNQKRLIIHKFIKEPSESYSSNISQRKYQNSDNDNTYLYGKRTQTDVISQKQSFIEEQEENYLKEQLLKKKKKRQINDLILQNDVYQIRGSNSNFHKTSQKRQQKYTEQQQVQIITEILKYDENQTQLGWLEHRVDGNNKFLLIQTNDLLSFNRAVSIQLQKVQLRAKIIEIQIQNNLLKIALRKSQSSKHINFSLDFKHNTARKPFLKIPKKIDNTLRSHCSQLQKIVKKLRKQDQQNSKELSLLDFYHSQFQKKVNYAYIYQEYLIQRGKKQLQKSFMINLSQSKHKNIKGLPKLKHFDKSLNKKVSQKSLSFTNRYKIEKVKLNSSSDQSNTSLANKMKRQQTLSSPIKIKNQSIKNMQTPKQLMSLGFLKGQNRNLNIISKRTINQTHEHLLSSEYNDYLGQTFNKDQQKSNQNKLVLNKKMPLTHHKQLSLPSKQKFVTLSSPEMQETFLPLFNTPNRQKKHFFYECQTYLRELQFDYLFECQADKQNSLKKNQNGFRQKEFLKIKALQVKNQILNTEVDIIGKQKQLKKQNDVLKRQLKLLQQRMISQFGNLNQVSDNKKRAIKSFKDLNISNLKSQNNFGLLYKQAQHRLKSFKSETMFQSISKPNIPKSPKKNSSQQLIKDIDRKPAKNKIECDGEKSDVRTLKKSPQFIERANKSPEYKKKFMHRESKRANLINRFKKSFSENKLNLTIKQNTQYSLPLKQQKLNKLGKDLNRQNAKVSTPSTEVVETQYYAIGV